MKKYRLFFALWPDEKVRYSIIETLSSLRPSVEGRVMQPHNLHITLHFIGQVDEERKQCMHDAAETISARPFELDLNSFGHFPKAKIFWMGTQNVPAQLIQLHKQLSTIIENCGFNSEVREFLPHVTLLRKCSKVDFAKVEFCIPWYVKEFVLVESITYPEGVDYQVIEKYPLF